MTRNALQQRQGVADPIRRVRSKRWRMQCGVYVDNFQQEARHDTWLISPFLMYPMIVRMQHIHRQPPNDISPGARPQQSRRDIPKPPHNTNARSSYISLFLLNSNNACSLLTGSNNSVISS